MLYKTNDPDFKDSLHFRCECGANEFLDVTWTDEWELEVSFIQCTWSFWDRLRWLFTPEYWTRYIMLSKSDTVELKKFLSKVLAGTKK